MLPLAFFCRVIPKRHAVGQLPASPDSPTAHKPHSEIPLNVLFYLSGKRYFASVSKVRIRRVSLSAVRVSPQAGQCSKRLARSRSWSLSHTAGQSVWKRWARVRDNLRRLIGDQARGGAT